MTPLGLRHIDSGRAIEMAAASFTPDRTLEPLEDLAIFLRLREPESRLELEHLGLDSSVVAALSANLGIGIDRIKEILGLPRGESLPTTGGHLRIRSGPGFAALALVELFGKAMEIVEGSTAPGARGFNTAMWLGRWIERPQPALSGIKPSALIALPTGLPTLLRLLGAMESGSYL